MTVLLHHMRGIQSIPFYCSHIVSFYLSWLRVDHAYDILPLLHPSVVGPVARALWVFADMVALATPQTEIHVADASPQLRIPTTVAPLTFLWPAP